VALYRGMLELLSFVMGLKSIRPHFQCHNQLKFALELATSTKWVHMLIPLHYHH
jgi:hypothetical protein